MMERLDRLQLLQQTVCMQLDRVQLDRLHRLCQRASVQLDRLHRLHQRASVQLDRLHQKASVQLDRLHQRASVESLQNCLHAKLPAKLSAYSKTIVTLTALVEGSIVTLEFTTC